MMMMMIHSVELRWESIFNQLIIHSPKLLTAKEKNFLVSFLPTMGKRPWSLTSHWKLSATAEKDIIWAEQNEPSSHHHHHLHCQKRRKSHLDWIWNVNAQIVKTDAKLKNEIVNIKSEKERESVTLRFNWCSERSSEKTLASS